MSSPNPPFTTALLAGGIAGTTVDMTLFPLDTLKTRLQSSEGFFASGGFRGIYRGIGSAALGSAPGAAFFFCTYEATKSALAEARTGRRQHQQQAGGKPEDGGGNAVDHMLAASLGEVAACAVRVPTEVVKQRAQAGQHGGSSMSSLLAILDRRRAVGLAGVWRELYRGWGITIMREVPFTVIQFPLWEALKSYSRGRRQQQQQQGNPTAAGHGGGGGEDVSAGESAVYGSVAGAVAAAVTTPLDVIKTRVMLSSEKRTVWDVVSTIVRENGARPFFAGIGPRVMWISIGGAVFLGSYQWVVNALERGRLNRAPASEFS